ncbi:MAG: amidohydrolase [Gammaproteobacteria bacterium]|nr:amidohydrolase [Gammaproteobacteria bacterium]
MKTIIKNGQFLLRENDELIVSTANLIIENNMITSIVKSSDDFNDLFSEESLIEKVNVIDGRNKLYMPGLINAHTHTPMSLLRGYADDVSLREWFEHIWPIEAKLDGDAIKWASLLSIVEMIQSGTTCFLDMYDHMEQIAECVDLAGMRTCLCRGVIDFCSKQELDAKLQEVRALTVNWHGKAEGRISTMIAPHSLTTVTSETLNRLVRIADEFSLPIHTHFAEVTADVAEIKHKYKLSPTRYLLQHGVLNRKCLLAHAVHIDEDDINILSEHDVSIAHNPSSNLKLGSGMAPIPEFLEKNINVAFGTDSSASNNRLDVFTEMRATSLLYKGFKHDPELFPATQVIDMATINGARALFLEDVGELRVGARADLIAVNIDQPHFYPHSNLISSLVYSASGADVVDVWVDGRQLMKNKELLTIDIDKTVHEFKRVYKRFF